MRASPKTVFSPNSKTKRKRKNGAMKIQCQNILEKTLLNPTQNSKVESGLTSKFFSTPCLIPFEIFAFRSSSMKRNREGTHKFPKPIKKVILKTATVIRKPNKAADNQVKPRLKAEEEEEEEEQAPSQGGISVPRTLTLLPSTFLEKWPILTSDFYQIDALDLAPRLLGKYLRRDEVVLQITEVEAYRPNDSACHGRFGITARTAPVFGPGGHAYVYLCYGLHTMLNIVADKEGVGAAVLVRSCAPINGLETIQQRRGIKTEKPILLTGPGKVGQALGISTEWSHHSLFTPGGLELLDGPKPDDILVGPRVGINYALPEHVNALWRFAIASNTWISAPKSTLRPS